MNILKHHISCITVVSTSFRILPLFRAGPLKWVIRIRWLTSAEINRRTIDPRSPRFNTCTQHGSGSPYPSQIVRPLKRRFLTRKTIITRDESDDAYFTCATATVQWGLVTHRAWCTASRYIDGSEYVCKYNKQRMLKLTYMNYA